MGRKTNNDRLEEIGEAIENYPNQHSGWYADFLDLDHKAVNRALIHLEDRGDLLVEDDQGRLSWFDRKK